MIETGPKKEECIYVKIIPMNVANALISVI